MNRQANLVSVLTETIFQRQLAELLVDHHQFGLIVDALFWDPTEAPERRIMHLNAAIGIDGPQAQAEVHQPREGQHKHQEVDRGDLACDHDIAQFTAVDLALHTRQIVYDRFVVAHLRVCHERSEARQVAPQTTFRDVESGRLRLKLAHHLRLFQLRMTSKENAEAQSKLGLSYLVGRGVPQEFVQAHMWFNLAAANGDKSASEYRDQVGNNMTSEQLAEAQRLACEWMAAHPDQ